MSDNKRTRLTLDERLALAAQSRASSPEAAAALVRRFAGLPAAYVFCGGSDVEAMNELTGEFWEDSRVDIDSYRGFCPSFELALTEDSDSGQELSREESQYQPLWGVRSSNALVLLGEMLLDQAMGRRPQKDVYHCLRMTLGQYLDILTGPDFRRSESEAEWFRFWKNDFIKGCDEDQPLAETLAMILRRYIAAWKEIGRLDHILRCLGGLALHQEQVGTKYELEPLSESERLKDGASLSLKVDRTESAQSAWHCLMALRRYDIDPSWDELPKADPACEDPQEYFLGLAREYAPNLPDPGSEMEVKTLRSQIFLPYWDYSPGTLRELAENLPFPEFKPLLEEYLPGDRLAAAMDMINMAVTDLYMLWVEAYLWMGKTV